MSHNTYVTLMVMFAFALVLASAWTLKKHSDDYHRKEAAIFAFVSWLLMFGAIRHLEREHHESNEVAESQEASEVNEPPALYASKQTSITTKGGNTIDWITFTDESRSVPFGGGRTSRGFSAVRLPPHRDSGPYSSAGNMSGAESATDF